MNNLSRVYMWQKNHKYEFKKDFKGTNPMVLTKLTVTLGQML